MKALMQPLEAVAGFDDLKRQLKKNRGLVVVTGCLESQKAHIAAGLAEESPAVLLIAENELKAKELYEDYRLYDREVLLYPARDLIFYQADLSGNLLTRQRMQVIQALMERKNVTVITSAGGCMDYLLPLRVLKKHIRTLKNDSELDLESFSKELTAMGYERCAQVEASGQFSIRGGILDIFALTEENPWRIELWGDEIDSIRSFDAESQRSIENLSEITIYPATEEIGRDEKGFFQRLTDTFPDYFPEDTRIFLDEPGRILESAKALFDEYRECMIHRMEKGQIQAEEGNRLLTPEQLAYELNRRNCTALCLMELRKGSWEIQGQYSVTVKSVSPYNNQFPMLVKDLSQWKRAGYRVVLLSASRTRGGRLARDLQDEGLNAFYSEDADRILNPGEILVVYGNARRGFEYPMQKFVLITETDIFGKEQKKKKKKPRYSGQKIQSFAELSVGDYVVHENHGLGVYRGIEKVEMDHVVKDYIKIEYSGGSSLYIQATQLDALQKYAGADAKKPKLNRLGGQEWNKTKTRVRGAVANIAKELVALYAARQENNGYQYGHDTVWQREFEEMFPFEETEDQLAAIEATKQDMESTKIMDRLICGDVGYGKTEIAIRAAFKAVQENKQVVLLVPTTILAQQHYNTFMQRMKDFPVRVDLLCRFRTPAQQKKTLEDLKKGMVDILIGTHRVLSKDVQFKDLGLLVIDEEQRFGVTHKEKIKQMKESVDVLTLTATPIPRTLHMSLIGIRDMSVLEEPPLDRVPIQTYVMEYDEEMVREAISRELARGGQVYYVYNRVNNIVELTNRIAALVPEANVAFAHGQMKERELEQIMYSFINGDIDVLVSTTIIETGMDISNVNTIIIHDADQMGLSQLYQLRGRVGRANRTAYAFLMYRRNRMLKEVAEKRLHAIREFTELGSGVKIAMRDLEIRGAGNLLGAEQHGHMEAVGYDLYCKMLSEAVKEAKGIHQQEDFETSIDLVMDAFIPPGYIPNEGQKLDVYKRIASIENREEAEDMLEELLDRFGEPPRSVQNLLAVAELKALAHRAYVTEIKQTGMEIKITFYEKARLDVQGIPSLLEQYGRKLKFKIEANPYFLYQPGPPKKKRETVLDQVRGFMEDLSRYVMTDESFGLDQ
ncbi:transcription-repair coupling factor [Wansuia hejianensis]|uniref:Transcription-repair-coupling factor n=1 Tax=Wansuia hejianensis TaxID=2763667 RepID=A0A7G9GAD1_9FIRM|nr:transcription-repair coupling factor [Wansuia hejianensis]QNM07763.1 transcription-repair coupling factor [Wansuia hejianensis]